MANHLHQLVASVSNELVILETTIKEADALADVSDGYRRKASELMVSAGLRYADAQRLCQAQGLVWSSVYKEHGKHSERHVRRCLALARAPDPEMAAEEMRASEAHRQRERRAAVRTADLTQELGEISSPVAEYIKVPQPILAAAKAAVNAMTTAERAQFRAWFAEVEAPFYSWLESFELVWDRGRREPQAVRQRVVDSLVDELDSELLDRKKA
jgi:hypothetical protein